MGTDERKGGRGEEGEERRERPGREGKGGILRKRESIKVVRTRDGGKFRDIGK